MDPLEPEPKLEYCRLSPNGILYAPDPFCASEARQLPNKASPVPGRTPPQCDGFGSLPSPPSDGVFEQLPLLPALLLLLLLQLGHAELPESPPEPPLNELQLEQLEIEELELLDALELQSGIG